MKSGQPESLKQLAGKTRLTASGAAKNICPTEDYRKNSTQRKTDIKKMKAQNPPKPKKSKNYLGRSQRAMFTPL